MGNAHRRQTLTHAQRHKQQEQRYTGDDVGVDHRHRVQQAHHLTTAGTHVIDTDRGQSAQYRRAHRSNQRNDHRVPDGAVQTRVRLAGEQVRIQVQRESRPVTEDLTVGEREHRDQCDRGVQHQQQHPQVRLRDIVSAHTHPFTTQRLLLHAGQALLFAPLDDLHAHRYQRQGQCHTGKHPPYPSVTAVLVQRLVQVVLERITAVARLHTELGVLRLFRIAPHRPGRLRLVCVTVHTHEPITQFQLLLRKHEVEMVYVS